MSLPAVVSKKRLVQAGFELSRDEMFLSLGCPDYIMVYKILNEQKGNPRYRFKELYLRPDREERDDFRRRYL